MAGSWWVVPPGFVKRPADRASFATCSFVDAAMGLVVGIGVTVAVAVLLSPFSVHPGGPTGAGEMSAWGVAMAVGAGSFGAVCCMAFGTGGRSVGHMVAEIRVGRAGGPPRRGLEAEELVDGGELVDDLVVVAPVPSAARSAPQRPWRSSWRWPGGPSRLPPPWSCCCGCPPC